MNNLVYEFNMCGVGSIEMTAAASWRTTADGGLYSTVKRFHRILAIKYRGNDISDNSWCKFII
jgi:hypothetical protein